jgi:hypothetical protein
MNTLRNIFKTISNVTRRRRPQPPEPVKKVVPVAQKEETPTSKLQEQVDNYAEKHPEFIFNLVTSTKVFVKSKLAGENDNCAEFTVKSNEVIYLNQLNKCSGFSGTDILKLVEDFAKQNNFKAILLQDASELEGNMRIRSKKLGYGRCALPLSVFNVLATGQSWYNSHGYVSTVGYKKDGKTINITEVEKEHNARIIEKPFVKFIEDINERVQLDEKRKKYLVDGAKYFIKKKADREKITVKQLFSKIKEELKLDGMLDCNDKNKKHNWIIDVCMFCLSGGASVELKRDIKEDNIFIFAAKLEKEL